MEITIKLKNNIPVMDAQQIASDLAYILGGESEGLNVTTDEMALYKACDAMAALATIKSIKEDIEINGISMFHKVQAV